MRDWLNNNAAAVAAGAVVLLLAAGVVVYLTTRGEQRSTSVYYYDLGTGNLFDVPRERLSPRPELADIPAPSGGAAARAYVYSCGACEPGTWQVAYIARYTDKARRAAQQLAGAYEAAPGDDAELAAAPGQGLRELEQAVIAGGEVAAPSTSPQWVAVNSPKGQALVRAPLQMCQGQPPTECTP